MDHINQILRLTCYLEARGGGQALDAATLGQLESVAARLKRLASQLTPALNPAAPPTLGSLFAFDPIMEGVFRGVFCACTMDEAVQGFGARLSIALTCRGFNSPLLQRVALRSLAGPRGGLRPPFGVSILSKSINKHLVKAVFKYYCCFGPGSPRDQFNNIYTLFRQYPWGGAFKLWSTLFYSPPCSCSQHILPTYLPTYRAYPLLP